MREYPSDRVDVRSDTVTQPTAAMRAVMEKAEVGDDVLGDDPTVNELQNRLNALQGENVVLAAMVTELRATLEDVTEEEAEDGES